MRLGSILPLWPLLSLPVFPDVGALTSVPAPSGRNSMADSWLLTGARPSTQHRGGQNSLSPPLDPEAAGRNTYSYVNRLRPGERFWEYYNFAPQINMRRKANVMMVRS